MKRFVLILTIFLILIFSTQAFALANNSSFYGPLQRFFDKAQSLLTGTNVFSGGAANVATNLTPFGGPITFIETCCLGDQILTVGGPRPGRFLFVPLASQLYREGMIKEGSWVLGNAWNTIGFCYLQPGCLVPSGYQGVVYQIGTSK